MSGEVKDINEIFEDILLTEENITREGYQEGFQTGVSEGNTEGYQIGYEKGLELGTELGAIYGTVVAYLQTTKSPKVIKTLEEIIQSIDKFPRTNDPNADIIDEIQNIRSQYKKVKAMLRIPDAEKAKNEDLSF